MELDHLQLKRRRAVVSAAIQYDIFIVTKNNQQSARVSGVYEI